MLEAEEEEEEEAPEPESNFEVERGQGSPYSLRAPACEQLCSGVLTRHILRGLAFLRRRVFDLVLV